MESLLPLISSLSTSDARSALYYLSRHLKQAALFKAYRKDIFEDEKRSSPSKVVRNATLEMLRYIESVEGKPASKFSDRTYSKWASRIADVESKLDPEASDREAEQARKFVDDMDLPPVRQRGTHGR
jgi:hypothetical protein